MTTTTIRGSTGVRMAAAVSLALVVSAVAAGCGGGTPSAPTARVERGMVATKVSASGALAAVTSQNLGFPKGQQLKEVNVKVGDRVQPGQVLARIDDFAFRQALNQEQSKLDEAQARLDKASGNPAIGGAKDSLSQAKEILDATKSNVDEQIHLDEELVDRARKQWEFDLRAARKACSGDPSKDMGGGSAASSGGSGSNSGFGSGSGGGFGNGGSSGGGGLLGSLGGAAGSAMNQNEQDQCTPAKRQALLSKTEYEKAKHQKDVDATKGRIDIERAKQEVVTAQNNLDTAENDKPSDTDAAAAVVAQARAAVALAQKDVDNAVLYAPVAGTVSAINGAVGEFIGNGSGTTTSKAPGTNASIPGVGAAATSDASSSSATGAPSATRPGGGAFIVLNDVNSFQVVVPFEESDAAKVKPGQKVQVSFDAIPDLTREGTVLSIAPSGTAISGVTNYYATVLLTETDPRLKTGQTAEAGVLVNSMENVLVVPNAAVVRQGGRSFVNAPGPDGKPMQLPFQPGAVGDDTTQVLSGLREGQEILLPQAQVQGTGPKQGGGG